MSSGPTPGLPEWRTERFERLESTQSLLRERLEAGQAVHGLVIRADEQLAGRGRREKNWASAPGGSYQSFAVTDLWDGALRTPVLTLELATALAAELREAGARASVKWPNDIYLGAGKLAGILTEYLRGHLVVGVGVNVGNPVPENGAALVGWDPTYANGLVLQAAHVALARVVEQAPGLAERLEDLDHLRGKRVRVHAQGAHVAGVAAGVDSSGALQVATDTGLVRVPNGTVLDWSD